ncbi:MAG: hypothetical protein OK454_11270, partial [Thaumarchaeota archaeon]|nr:hypothetical protein [Nitrososphaerota archaeon]
MHGLTFESYSRVTNRRRIIRQEGTPEDQEDIRVETAGASNKLRIIVIGLVLVIILGISGFIFLSNPTPTGLVMGPAKGTVTEANSSDL